MALTKITDKQLNRGGLVNAFDDVDAASAGEPIGWMYRNGSVLMVRVA